MMMPKEMDSLDTVEIVMAIEEALGVEIPGSFESPSELVDRLEAILSNRQPNIEAVALLRNSPEISNNLNLPRA